jgi:hypothetical protein
MVSLWGLGGTANPNNLGMSSKKIYSSSGYLELDLDFRIVDWKGTGQPLKSAFLLSAMALPKNKANYTASQVSINTIDKFIKFFGSAIADKNMVNQTSNDLMKLIKDTFGIAEEGVIKILNAAPGMNGKEITGYLNSPEFFTLASSPLPVTIKIGQYFEHSDMIIETVGTEFSKSMTEFGPLYSDFKIHTSSRQTILLDDNKPPEQQLGLKSPKKMNRILR